MEGSLWRETSGRSLGSYNAAVLVGGMCHGNGFQQETTRLHSIDIVLHKDGMELSHPQSSASPSIGSIPSREQSPACR